MIKLLIYFRRVRREFVKKSTKKEGSKSEYWCSTQACGPWLPKQMTNCSRWSFSQEDDGRSKGVPVPGWLLLEISGRFWYQIVVKRSPTVKFVWEPNNNYYFCFLSDHGWVVFRNVTISVITLKMAWTRERETTPKVLLEETAGNRRNVSVDLLQ